MQILPTLLFICLFKAIGIVLLRTGDSGGISEVGFYADYQLDDLSQPLPTVSPSAFPSISASPTELKPDSVEACQCDVLNRCAEEPLFQSSPYVRLCLLAQPQTSEFIGIIVLVFADPNTSNKTPIITDNVPSDNSTIVFIDEKNERRHVVETVVPKHFFDNSAQYIVANGIVSIMAVGDGGGFKRDFPFSTTLSLLSGPSSAPSEPPTASSGPTLNPSGKSLLATSM